MNHSFAPCSLTYTYILRFCYNIIVTFFLVRVFYWERVQKKVSRAVGWTVLVQSITTANNSGFIGIKKNHPNLFNGVNIEEIIKFLLEKVRESLFITTTIQSILFVYNNTCKRISYAIFLSLRVFDVNIWFSGSLVKLGSKSIETLLWHYYNNIGSTLCRGVQIYYWFWY